MNEKLLRLLSDALGVSACALGEDSSTDNTPAWDSVMHLNICLSVEQAFGVELTPEEMLEMTSVRAIEATIAEHGAA